MNAPMAIVFLFDIAGAVLTIILSAVALLKMRGIYRHRKDFGLYTYLYAQTIALFIFAVSRSAGHIIKHILLTLGYPTIWEAIAPISGSINSFSFIGFGIAAILYSNVKSITDRVDALIYSRKELKESEQFSKLLLNSTAEAIYGVDNIGNCTFCNPSCMRLLGYENEADLLGKNMHELIHHTRSDGSKYPNEECRAYNAYKTGKGVQVDDEVFWRSDGTSFPVEYSSYPIFQNIAIVGAVVTFLDISERKNAENKIIASLKEKEVLLKEVHHRVKNNMAVIASLLNLQSRYIDDKKYKDMFKECQSRIRSMALVHEKLYQTQDFSVIDLKDYILTLIQSIRNTFGSNKEYYFNTEIDNIQLDLDILIPCGLIINEILTNSFKYAFNSEEKAEINITIKRLEGDNISLIISDNGKGLPDDFEISDSSGLGLQLVSALTEQIEGTLEIKSEQGSEFKLVFPANLK